MSKRNRNQSPAAGGRARSAPVKIDKPFPWGTVAVGLVLGALLIGIIVYAVMNTGSGVRNLLKEEDESFPTLTVEESPARDHVEGPVEYDDYPARPPLGGEHNSLPQQCGVYTEQIPAEHAVHSMEHGAVWVTYQPDLPEDQVSDLKEMAEGTPYGLMSPLPEQEAPIVVTAWGRQLEADSVDDDDVERFIRTYADGRQTPEKGAACAGNSQTGTTPFVQVPQGEQPAPAPTS
jgi:hypothetical protein